MLTVTTKTTVEINTPMCVKELAPVLSKGVGYVYKMRMAGFPMNRNNGVAEATPKQAMEWIKRVRFRIIHGRVKTG